MEHWRRVLGKKSATMTERKEKKKELNNSAETTVRVVCLSVPILGGKTRELELEKTVRVVCFLIVSGWLLQCMVPFPVSFNARQCTPKPPMPHLRPPVNDLSVVTCKLLFATSSGLIREISLPVSQFCVLHYDMRTW
ncbi:hypothetical protein BaRGS_00021209 [Batillaria attramentaria]|uniref:Uncharacterized protein n=1 Tax=Batillaria attramentaria TaxID=370345 RepID=A0ABD0KKE3_9CAEN